MPVSAAASQPTPTAQPAIALCDAEAEQLAAARGGDAGAFGELIRRHQRRLYALLVRRMGNELDAEDVLQSACLLAWRKLDQFRGDAAFSTWLTRIALTQAASHARKRSNRSAASLTQPDGTMTPLADSQPTASEATEAAETTASRERLVREAIGKLPDEQRDVVVLKEFDGRSYLEIAEITGCPVGTVRSRLHRARKELCELLKPLLRDLDSPPPGLSIAGPD